MMALTAMLLLTFAAGVFALALAIGVIEAADRARRVAAAAGLDLVQFYAAWSQAHLDTRERAAKLDAATDLAALQLNHRAALASVKEDALVLELGYKAHRVRAATREGGVCKTN